MNEYPIPKKLLAVLIDPETRNINRFSFRKAVRIILLSNHDEVETIALQHVQASGFIKLPGGGIERDESLKSALEREIREEVGASDFEVKSPLGTVIEVKAANEEDPPEIQHSYCYHGELRTSRQELSELSLDDQEKKRKATLKFMQPEVALEEMKSFKEETEVPVLKSILKRDILFMEEFLKTRL